MKHTTSKSWELNKHIHTKSYPAANTSTESAITWCITLRLGNMLSHLARTRAFKCLCALSLTVTHSHLCAGFLPPDAISCVINDKIHLNRILLCTKKKFYFFENSQSGWIQTSHVSRLPLPLPSRFSSKHTQSRTFSLHNEALCLFGCDAVFQKFSEAWLFSSNHPTPSPSTPFRAPCLFFFPPPFPGSKSHKVNLAKSWGNCGTWVLNMESWSCSNGGSEAEEILLNKGERADTVHRWWHQIMTSSSHWLHFCQISSICDLLNTSPCPASLGFLKSVNIMVCWTLSLQMQGQNTDCLPTLKLVRTITSWSFYKMTW